MEIQSVSKSNAAITNVSQPCAKLDRWTIYHTLGRGFSSKVKLARDEETGEYVAIKLVKHSAEQEKIESVRREAKILNELSNKSIIKMKGYSERAEYRKSSGKTADVSAIVLEYASSGDLFDYSLHSEGFKEPVVRKFAIQLLEALRDCHQNNIAHRDIKPQNILFDDNFNAKLADFGFAISNISSREITRTENFVGTENFAAPEIYSQSATYDPKAADIFALGVTLFIMRCGTLPFHQATASDNFYSLIMRGEYAQFWRLHMMRRGSTKAKAVISSDFKDLVTKMLVADPKERLTVEDVLSHEWLRGEVPLTEDILPVFRGIKQKLAAN